VPPDVQLPARLALGAVRPPLFQELVNLTGRAGIPALSFKKRPHSPRGYGSGADDQGVDSLARSQILD